MEKKDRKTLLIAAVVVSAVLAFVIIILTTMNRQQYTGNGNESTGYGSEIDAPSAVFENRAKLNKIYGRENSAIILTEIEEIVMSEKEIAAAPKENNSSDGIKTHYDTKLVEESFKLYSERPEVYTFNIEMSDGREYEAFVRQDSEYDVDMGERNICYTVVLIRDEEKNYRTTATVENLKNVLEAWQEDL